MTGRNSLAGDHHQHCALYPLYPMSQSFLGIDDLSFSSLFPSSQPSYVRVTPTNPRDTDISTADTIQLMNQHSKNDSQHPLVEEAAQEIMDSCGISPEGPSSPLEESELVQGTFDYLKDHITFTEDENILKQLFGIDSGAELLISPARLLSMNRPMGDCDDFSMLTKSILLNMGIDNDFVTVAADREHPQKWSHVYNMVTLKDGTDKFVDTSHGKYLGWEAPGANRKVVWKLKDQISREVKTNMFVDRYDAFNKDHGMGDYYDPESGLMITSPYDNAGGPGGVVSPSFPTFPASGAGSGINWTSLLSPFTKAASTIAVAQYGQPQLAPGTFIRGPQGQILTNQPITGGAFSSLGSGVSSLGGSGLLIGAVVIGGLILLGGRR